MSIYNCVTLYLGFGFKMEVCHATERKNKMRIRPELPKLLRR